MFGFLGSSKPLDDPRLRQKIVNENSRRPEQSKSARDLLSYKADLSRGSGNANNGSRDDSGSPGQIIQQDVPSSSLQSWSRFLRGELDELCERFCNTAMCLTNFF